VLLPHFSSGTSVSREKSREDTLQVNLIINLNAHDKSGHDALVAIASNRANLRADKNLYEAEVSREYPYEFTQQTT